MNNHCCNNHEPLKCRFCSKNFNNPGSSCHHGFWHMKNFVCPRCDKAFPFESQLLSHKEKHHQLSTFACFYPGCKKMFRREASLVAHVRVHKGLDIKCDQCGYTCKNRRYLTQHYRMHTGEKKYSCKHCNKQFTFY